MSIPSAQEYSHLQTKLNDGILCTLEEKDFRQAASERYIPIYTRTDLTDALHETLGFGTNYEISNAQMKKFLNSQKNRKNPQKLTLKRKTRLFCLSSGKDGII